MKKLVFLIALCSVFHSYGQTTIFNNSDNLDSLDAIYLTLTIDTFPGTTQKCFPEYATLLKGLGKYLSTYNFHWENDCKIYTKFYVNVDGKVEAFLYEFLRFSISEEKEKQFQQLLINYFSEEDMNLKEPASIPFSMGGCNSFRAPEPKK